LPSDENAFRQSLGFVPIFLKNSAFVEAREQSEKLVGQLQFVPRYRPGQHFEPNRIYDPVVGVSLQPKLSGMNRSARAAFQTLR